MMGSTGPSQEKICPDCGATLPENGGDCWLCDLAIEGATPAAAESPAPATDRLRVPVDDDEKPVPLFERPAACQFSLASVLLIITLFAVLLSVFRLAIEQGIAFAIGLEIVLVLLVAPTLVRSCLLASRSRAVGRPMSIGRKVWVFAGTFGLLAIIAVAVLVAYIATAYSIGMAGIATNAWHSELGFLVGIAPSLLVLYFISRAFRGRWPR